MSVNQHLPPDLQGHAGGIGGKARENKSSAAAHGTAMSAASGQSRDPEPEPTPVEPEEVKEPASTECSRCKNKVTEEHNFCSRCGSNLLKSPLKELGITFSDEDLDEYLFKGSLTKNLTILGKDMHVRSSVADDHRLISDYLMSEWDGKPATQDFWENLRSTASISMAIVSFDGRPMPESLKDRVEWMLKLGSALHDKITRRVVLYNRAITEWLDDKSGFFVS